MSSPSNNKWRLSGALGLATDPIPHNQEVITQGIGFPMRPVDGVPFTDTPSIPTGVVAEGLFTQFMPNGYEAGKYYPAGSMLGNGEYTMVASVLTLEYPYPKPEDDPTFGITAFTPTTESNSAVVYSGNLFTFTSDVWVRTLRVWVTQLTVDTNYRIIAITTPPNGVTVTTVFEEPLLTEDAWKTIGLLNQLIPAGTTMLIYIDGLNSGADNTVTGGWNFTGQDNNNSPAAQGWNHNNANTFVRIDKTDLDGTDRASELQGITVGSTLVFSDTSNPSAFNQYRVTGEPIDAGTSYNYPTVLQEQGEGGVPQGVTTLTATVPIPQPTEYAEEVGLNTPAWGNMQGYLAFDGVEQVAGQVNTYGVDIECDISINPEDWKLLSFNTL